MLIATAEQMRAIDRHTIEKGGISALVLMEHAGMAVYEKLAEAVPSPGAVAIICGKGNNGGDGLVVARLAMSHGYLVDCLVATRENELSSEASHMLASLRASGCEPTFADSTFWQAKLEALSAHDILVDAILGTGTRSELKPELKEVVEAMNVSMVPILAIDLPSGVDTDTGAELGAAVIADFTVVLGLPKPGLLCGAGPIFAGDWSVADIGLHALSGADADLDVLLEAQWVADRLPQRTRNSYKGDNGHVLIVAGSERFRGAASLAAFAALKAGAGLVTVAAPEVVCAAVASHVPEAIFLPLGSQPWQQILELHDRVDAGLFGPGLGQSDATKAMLTNVFREWSRPALVDADALNAVSAGVSLPNAACVLTPHPGELARLMNSTTGEVEANRFAAARRAASTLGQTLLSKGVYSIVAAPGQPLLVNSTGNPGMATGGSGDTLSGVIATFLAQGLGPRDAAACGMFLCGMAADLTARQMGSVGYSPSEVAAQLPRTRDMLIESCAN